MGDPVKNSLIVVRRDRRSAVGALRRSFFYTSNPLTSPPASVSRAWAMRRMLWRLRLRWPRSTWPMYDQCRVVRSASFSCDRSSCSRRARTRRPNSPVAGESGGLRSAGTAPSQPAKHSQSRDDISQDDVSCRCPWRSSW